MGLCQSPCHALPLYTVHEGGCVFIGGYYKLIVDYYTLFILVTGYRWLYQSPHHQLPLYTVHEGGCMFIGGYHKLIVDYYTLFTLTTGYRGLY